MNSNQSRLIRRFDNRRDMAAECASFLAAEISGRLDGRGRLNLALAGGSSPAPVYARLRAEQGIDWKKVHFFFSDERLVPLTDKASNYRMAEENLLGELRLPQENVHPVNVNMPNADEAARDYELRMRAHFGLEGPKIPGFDIILLGMGDDGHTASLFPGAPALVETEKLIAPVDGAAGNPPVDRVTFTLPLINAADMVVFIVAGQDKLRIVDGMELDRGGMYPAAEVSPAGRSVWFASP